MFAAAMAERPSTIDDLRAWIEAAEPGERFVYHRGLLGRDAQDIAIRRLRKVAADAWVTGFFDLTQRRLAPDDYAYVIARRRTREPARVWYVRKEDDVRAGQLHAGVQPWPP